MSSSETTNWFVQILFGRYQQQQPTISWTEVIILVAIGIVMSYFYLFILRFKFHHFSTALNNIPPPALPLTTDQLSRRMYATLIDEMVRVDHITHHNLTPASTTHPSDAGWGDAHSQLSNIHFTTSIAKSFILLESTAITRRPGLKHRGWRTVREYVQQLRKAFPGLRAGLCDEYIRAYERSVFGEGKVGIDEYSDFMKVVYDNTDTHSQHTHTHTESTLVNGSVLSESCSTDRSELLLFAWLGTRWLVLSMIEAGVRRWQDRYS